MINGLDLFSGIGGLTLSLSDWVRPITYCENDRYAQAVLLSKMASGALPYAPIWDDIRSLDGSVLPKPDVDIIYGGFPCQDISVAGNGIGLEGKRSGLFFDIIRLTRDLRPRFVFLENVPAITVRGLDRVLLEFTALGYDTRWTIVSASEVGACHRRDRWFLLAHSNGIRGRNKQVSKSRVEDTSSTFENSEDTADSHGARLQRVRRNEPTLARPVPYGGWKSEPTVRGRTHGVFNRVDRVKSLGNAVVPVQAREAFMRLSGIS